MAKPWYNSVGVRAALITGAFGVASSLILVLGGSSAQEADDRSSHPNLMDTIGNPAPKGRSDQGSSFTIVDMDSTGITDSILEYDPAPSIEVDTTQLRNLIQHVKQSVPVGGSVLIRIETTDTTGLKILHEIKKEGWNKGLEFRIELSNWLLQAPNDTLYTVSPLLGTPFAGIEWSIAPKRDPTDSYRWGLAIRSADSVDLNTSPDRAMPLDSSWSFPGRLGFYFQ